MNVLALDMASRTGVALQRDDGRLSVCNWYLARGVNGVLRSPVPWQRLWRRLQRLQRQCPVDFLVLESNFGSRTTGRFLQGLETIAVLFCMEHGLGWMRIMPKAWKKAVCNSAKATPTQYLQWAREEWPEQKIRTPDQAAALCLLRYRELSDALMKDGH